VGSQNFGACKVFPWEMACSGTSFDQAASWSGFHCSRIAKRPFRGYSVAKYLTGKAFAETQVNTENKILPIKEECDDLKKGFRGGNRFFF